MKTIFFLLGISFLSIFLFTGTSTVHASSPASGFDTFVSTTGGLYYAKDSQNNILASSSTPDIVIKTALSKNGDVNIATGSYILSSTFSGFDILSNTHVKLAKDAIIVVPSGFSGYVFRFNSGSAHIVLEGGIIQEASPVKNSWTGILMQGGPTGIYFNLVENMVMYNPNVAIAFNAAAGQWINGNTFVNIQASNFVKGIQFDLSGSTTGRNIDGNTFRDSSFQSGPMTTFGVKDIPNDDNAFYNVQFLNLPPNAISATVDSTAVNTVIIGGTMTSQGFVDNGQNTIIADRVHLPGDTGAPTITIPSENSLLDNQTPTISGISASGPFSIINVYNNNTSPATLIGTVTSDAHGVWSITPPVALPDGPYRLSANIGPAGTASPLRHFTIDTGGVGTIVYETYDGTGQGIFWAKDSQNNILTTSTTPDNVIKTALARGGDIYIGTGAYFFANTFSGFDLVSNTHLKISKTAYLVVPSGFSGHVFRFSSGVVLGVLEGGIIEEASPIKRSWTGILMQGGTSGINLNRIENIVLYDSYIPVEFNGAAGEAGINSNTFFNIQGYNFVRGIEFDYTGIGGSGFNTNTFLDSPFQSGSMTTYGAKDIKFNDNAFNNAQFWDLPLTTVSSSTVDSTAKNTVVIGGIMTHVRFVDAGSSTAVVDRSRITGGAIATGIISGTVYYDLNVNKIQDVNELGTPGVTITLDNAVGTKIGTTTTDLTGHYTFTNVPSGNFTVFETIPSGQVNIQPGGATPGAYYYNLLPGKSLTRNFGNHAPTILMQDTAITTGYGTSFARQINAQYVGTSSVLVGKNIDTMVLTLKRTGTPGGTASIGVFNSDLSVKKLFATLWVSDVSTAYTNYTFSLPPGQTYQIQAGDRIGIKYTSGDPWDLDTVAVDGNNGFDGINSYYTYYTTSWGTSTTSDLAMTLSLINNVSTSPTIYMQDTAVTDGYGTYSGRQINAENVGPSSVLVGKNIDTMILHLRKGGSPTGTASIGVFNPDLSIKKLFATLDVTTLTTTYSDYTFSLSSSSPYYSIQAGDRIGIMYSGGDSSNYAQVTSDKNNGFDGTNSYFTFYTSTWGSSTSGELTMTLELVNSSRVSPTIYMQDTAVTDGYGTYSARQINAENVSPSSALVGKNIDTVIMHLRKGGSPTGTASIGVFNPDLSVKKLFATLDVTTLTTTYSDYTFSLLSGQSYTMQAGDIIGIKYTGGDINNFVQITAEKNNGFDSTNSYYTFFTTSWGSLTGSDPTMTLMHY